MAFHQPPASNDEILTYENLVDEISEFLQANKDISQIQFQCLLQDAFQPQSNSEEEKASFGASAVPSDTSEPPSRRRKRSLGVARCFYFCALVLLSVLFAIVASRQAQHLAVRNSVTKTVHALVSNVVLPYWPFPPLLDAMYLFILRPARLLSTSVGLAIKRDLQDCYMSNPLLGLWQKEDTAEQECQCLLVKHILAPREDLDRERSLPLNPSLPVAQPIVLRQWGGHPNVLDLFEELMESAGILRAVPNIVSCSIENIPDMHHLTDADGFDTLVNNPTAHLEWIPTNYIGSSVVKKLFPLPAVLLENYFDPLRLLYLDGAESDAYDLAIGNDRAVYLQGSGSRKIILMPKAPCSSQCRYLSTHLMSGDILVYSGSVWKARSERIDGTSSLASVAVLSDD